MLHAHGDAQRRRLLRVGKACQSALVVGARRLGQDDQYLTVREILFRARSSRQSICQMAYQAKSCHGSLFPHTALRHAWRCR